MGAGCTPDSSFAVVETLRHRVQKFEVIGLSTAMFGKKRQKGGLNPTIQRTLVAFDRNYPRHFRIWR